MRSGHEVRDIRVGWVFGVVGVLALSAIAINFIIAAMLGHFNNKPAPGDLWRPVPQTAAAGIAPVAPYPKLQVAPSLDLQRFRAREEQQLNSYGWVNASAGIVHIPINAAMDQVLKRGLPTRQTGGPGNERGPSSYNLQLQRVEQEQQGAPHE